MSRFRWSILSISVLSSGLLLSGCSLSGPQSTFDSVAFVAQKQMSLLYFTTWLSLIVILGVGGVLAYSVFRYRSRSQDDEIPAQTHGNTVVEVGLILLATVITVIIAIPTVRTNFQTEIRVTPTEDDIVVNVTGHQWWWALEYPDEGIITANELHVPVGKRVILNLTSADVLHSFWVPQLAGKRDLIPNQDNQLWLITEDEDGNQIPEGVYFGQCAELCLGAHAYMRFRVVVESEEDYEAWLGSFQTIEPLASGTQLQQVQNDPLIAKGQELFKSKGCAACHAVKGFAGGAPDKPDLTNFGLRTTVAAGVLDNTPENLARWLRDPQEVKPTNYMPTLWSEDDPNREAEIEALVAYLLNLGTTEDETQASLGGNYGN